MIHEESVYLVIKFGISLPSCNVKSKVHENSELAPPGLKVGALIVVTKLSAPTKYVISPGLSGSTRSRNSIVQSIES